MRSTPPDAFPLVEVGATIVSQPADQAVVELGSATFRVVAEGNPAPAYQWYRDGLVVPGATNAVYDLPAVGRGDDQAGFHVVVSNTASNVAHAVASRTAVLRVTPDLVAPELVRAQALELTQVLAEFSEGLDPATVADLRHYAVSGHGAPVEVLAAQLGTGGTNVLLAVSSLTEGVTYTLTVEGLTDQAAARNPVPPGSQATFTAWSYQRSSLGPDAFPGEFVPVTGGFEVRAAGLGLVGTTDDCFFASQPRNGDFDVRVRVAALGPGDIWAQAGLMARDSMTVDAAGETVYLMNPARTRVLDAVRFPGQANGVASGRYPDGDRSRAQRTPADRTDDPSVFPPGRAAHSELTLVSPKRPVDPATPPNHRRLVLGELAKPTDPARSA